MRAFLFSLLAFALAIAALLPRPASAQETFVVTSTADPGDGTCDDAGAGDGCTLREALLAAEGTPARDSIAFAIPGAGVHVIAPASPLPTLTESVVIDGYSQRGAAPNTRAVGSDAVLRIELDMADAGSFGLDVRADSVTVRGLALDGGQTGLYLGGPAHRIEGNYIGTDASGTAGRGFVSYGIWVTRTGGHPEGTVIGGTTPAARNVIAQSLNGIQVQANGLAVQGNYIGTDASGLVALGNAQHGISVFEGARITLGGAAPGAGNVIAANGLVGVHLARSGSSGTTVRDVTVQGNLIGVGADGATPLGNARQGVYLFGNGGHRVGGPAPGAGNVIAHNGRDGYPGVLARSVEDVVVEGNTITANHHDGIEVWDDTAVTIRANRIAGNGTAETDLGIDLLDCGDVNTLGGPSANDPGDADEGANRCQNAPELLGSRVTGTGALRVGVRVDTDPANAAYPLTVELYRADAGQGAEVLGTATYTEADFAGAVETPLGTVLEGAVVIDLGDAAALGVAAGTPLVATATDADGHTSEFTPRPAAVDTEDTTTPTTLALHAPYPNPAVGAAALTYALPTPAPVRLALYDALGRRVAVLVDAAQPAGRHTATLDTRGLASGLYVARLEAGARALTRRLTVLR